MPGWYPDPSGRFEVRYHNGLAWTADVSTDGERYVDPLGTAPPVSGGAAAGPHGHGAPTGHDGTAGRNGPAIAALVLGIVSIAVGWLPFVVAVGAVAAVLAIVFGVVGRRRSGRHGPGAGAALAGLVTGSIGVLVCVGGVLFTMAFLRELDAYSNPAPHAVEIDRCTVSGSEASAAGRITNLGSEPSGFSLLVDFVRPNTDNPDRRARVVVDDIPPGGSAPFEVTRPVSLDEVDCVIARVDGPLPFGVEIGG